MSTFLSAPLVVVLKVSEPTVDAILEELVDFYGKIKFSFNSQSKV